MKRGTLLASTPKPASGVARVGDPPADPASEGKSRGSEDKSRGADLSSLPRHAKASTREGKRNITAFIDEATHRQLGRLAVDQGTKKQDLFVEALNLLFEKHGLPRIA